MAMTSLLLFLALTSTESPERCTRWHGTVSGNDPSVAVTVVLCERDDRQVHGTLEWRSRQSGTNTRRIAGAWAANRQSLALRDVGLVGKPKPGWTFCPIDRYELVRTREGLVGEYHSAACHDDAKVALVPVR